MFALTAQLQMSLSRQAMRTVLRQHTPYCRKTLRLYLACLSDAAIASQGAAQQGEAGQPPPLDALQAAAAYLASPPAATKAWEGSGKLAR